MAKKQRNRRRRAPPATVRPINWGGARPRRKRRREYFILAGVGALLVAGGAYWFWQSVAATRAFDALARSGQGALAAVRSEASQGRQHLQPGQRHIYQSAFPTSGPHDPIWLTPGFYEAPQPATRIVHALEHGNVAVYYGSAVADDALATIRAWTERYNGQWDGVIALPAPALDTAVVLTAWTKRLDLKTFDAQAAAAFIDAFRGRGPENPVR